MNLVKLPAEDHLEDHATCMGAVRKMEAVIAIRGMWVWSVKSHAEVFHKALESALVRVFASQERNWLFSLGVTNLFSLQQFLGPHQL